MVQVIAVNDVPVIDLPVEFSFNEDEMLEVDFGQYISDVDGDALSLYVGENPNVIVDIVGHVVTFSALANYNGSESIEFTVDDGETRVTASDEVSINVISVNDAPVAEAGAPINAVSGPEGTVLINLDASESFDIDGVIVDYNWSWFNGEANGEIVGVYLAEGNYTIALEITDDEGATDMDYLQVSVMAYGGVNPTGIPDMYAVDEDGVLLVSAEDGILANDDDDGRPCCGRRFSTLHRFR